MCACYECVCQLDPTAVPPSPAFGVLGPPGTHIQGLRFPVARTSRLQFRHLLFGQGRDSLSGQTEEINKRDPESSNLRRVVVTPT